MTDGDIALLVLRAKGIWGNSLGEEVEKLLIGALRPLAYDIAGQAMNQHANTSRFFVLADFNALVNKLLATDKAKEAAAAREAANLAYKARYDKHRAEEDGYRAKTTELRAWAASLTEHELARLRADVVTADADLLPLLDRRDPRRDPLWLALLRRSAARLKSAQPQASIT